MLRAIDGLEAVTLIGWWPVRGVVLAATVLAVLLVLRYARRVTSILLATALLAAMMLANLLLAQNAYYRSYPTVAAFLDDRPSDVAVPAVPRDTGTTLTLEIPAARSRFAARPAVVHLPPNPGAAPPVLMLLHGSPGAPRDWLDQAGAGRVADAWAAAHGGAAPILVIPDVTGGDGLGLCADADAARVESYLTLDVPDFVRTRFGTRSSGSGWAVAGHGAGGTCAVALALRHPDLFATFATFGGSAAGADPQHDPMELLRVATPGQVAGWFEAGAVDPAAAAATDLTATARSAGVEACFLLRPGEGPGYDTSGRALADALPWLAARVEGVAPPPEAARWCVGAPT